MEKFVASLLRTVRKNPMASAITVPALIILWRRGWLQIKHIAVLALLYFVRLSVQTRKISDLAREGSKKLAQQPIDTFEKAAAFSKACGGSFSDQQKLDLYGLYKQATVGDCTVQRPGALNMVGQYKWDAHKSRSGMSTDEAKAAYIKLCRVLQVATAGDTVEASNKQSSGGGLEQVQSVMSNVEGAADENDRDLAVFVSAKQFDELESSLKNGSAEVNATNEDGETALHIACDRGFGQAIQLLLQYGASAKAASADGTTPLHMLMCTGKENCDMVGLLVNAKADVNAQDEDGNTPIHQAVLNEEPELARALVDMRADLSLQNDEGESAQDFDPDFVKEKILALTSG